jgi:hypothetical protein
MAASNNTFFDVLIDRLIEDVRREFETPAEAPSQFDEPEKIVVGLNDMVAQMIGFRARIGTPAGNAIAKTHKRPTPRFAPEEIEQRLEARERVVAQPSFTSSAAQVAFDVVTKSGARFYENDLANDGITREALKRERRRVLLTLHPDRAPESDRLSAHEKFLAAAEAFTALAEASHDQARVA